MTLTVTEALDCYFKEHVIHNCVARERIEYAIEALKGFFYFMPLKDVDIPVCRAYRLYRGSIAAATVRRELGVLKAAANHARKWRRITKLEDLPIFELPVGARKAPVWLFKEELSILLETASTVDRRVFRFLQLAYHTAGRKEAIETLTWDRVSQEPRRINLGIPGRPETNKRRPIVPISENMSNELELMRSKAVNQWVLASSDNIRPAFDRVAVSAKLDRLPANGMRPGGRLTPHVLRHSRATHLLQDGKTPWAVANLLGDNMKTVLKVYGHACPNYLEEILENSTM